MNNYFRFITVAVVSAAVMALAPAFTSTPLRELHCLPLSTETVVGFERNSNDDPNTLDAFQEMILSLWFSGGDSQQLNVLSGLQFEQHPERLIFSGIRLSGEKERIVGIASGQGVHIPSAWPADRSSSLSIMELGKDRVIFGDSAAVKICAALDSAPPEKTLSADIALATRIEEFRTSGQAWGVMTRRSLGLEDSSREQRESWSLRGARSRLLLVGFSATMSAPVAFSMKTEAASRSDAAILADELRVFLRDAGSSGQAELKPVAAQAQVSEDAEAVRLGLELPMTAMKLLKGSRTARSVFTWELSALARENRQRIPEIFHHLGLQKGIKVADVGAGGGFFTVRLARAVGPEGRIWAVDIVPQIVESLRQRVRESRLDNVEVVPGEAANPKLPEAVLDAVLIVNSYHEMPHYSEILEHLSRALRPEGRLVVSEPFSLKRRSLPRAEQIQEHEIAPELIEEELRRAGFEIVFRDDKFIENRDSGMDSILVARRPK